MEIVRTDAAPAPAGPYSQGVKSNGFLFCSMQLPVDPGTGELAPGIDGQTRRVLENLKAVAEAAGSSLESAVKVTVYLTDLSRFGAVNAVYGEYLKNAPARACVEVSQLPKGALVSAEMVCELPD